MLALFACQPQLVEVEVEVTRLMDDPTVAATAAVTPLPTTTPTIIEVTRLAPQEVIVTVTSAPIGSETRPLQLLLPPLAPPLADTAVLSQRLQPLADALAAASGRHLSLGILDSERHVIELLCLAPAETIGFLSASGFMLAEQHCDIEAAVVGLNATGQPWQMGMIVVRQDSGIETVADLAGKTWAAPDEESLPLYLYFQALLADAGIEPGEITFMPGDSAAMLAVLNGEVDFATAAFIPPVMPYEERTWIYGEDDPELWRNTGILPGRSGMGYIIVNGGPESGGYRVRDARAGIFDTNRTIFRDTKIVALSAPIPNETIVFGAQFPVRMARQVTAVLVEFGASATCPESVCALNMYAWSAIAPAANADYEALRLIARVLGVAEEDLSGK